MGFIKIDRGLFESRYWKEKRVFSRAEAWIDLLQIACYKYETVLLPNGKELSLKPGELHASLRYLARRWGWGVQKVRGFINKAKKNGEITQRTTQGETTISVCKCAYYNKIDNNNNTANNTPTTQQINANIILRDENATQRTTQGASVKKPFNYGIPDQNSCNKNTVNNTPITQRQHSDNTPNNTNNKNIRTREREEVFKKKNYYVVPKGKSFRAKAKKKADLDRPTKENIRDYFVRERSLNRSMAERAALQMADYYADKLPADWKNAAALWDVSADALMLNAVNPNRIPNTELK